MRWRSQSIGARRKLVSSISHVEDSLKAKSKSRAYECYNFLADFWESTPQATGQMVLVVGWAVLVITLNNEHVLGANLKLDSTAGRAMTTILSFLIVFRTNQSYNRWWEGRILWGKMHW